MGTALKIIQALLPLVLEFIKAEHPDKTDDEHRDIARDVVNSALKK